MVVNNRIGLAISETAVRIVVARGSKIIHFDTQELPQRRMPDVVEQMLRGVARRRHQQPRVVVLLSPSLVQVRRLRGMPPVKNARVADSVVCASAGRFFLSDGGELVTSEPYWSSPNTEPWGAAVSASTLREIGAACTAASCKLVGVAPVVAAIGLAFENSCVIWRDGSVVTRTTLSPLRRPIDFARSLSASAETDIAGSDDSARALTPNKELANIGYEACQYADAYAAAHWKGQIPLQFNRSVLSRRGSAALPAWRLRLAASALACAVVVSTVGPGVNSELSMSRNQRYLSTIHKQRQEAAIAEKKLASVSGSLQQLAAFASERHSHTLTLSAFAKVLPSETGIITFRSDSAGIVVTLISANMPGALASFDSIPSLASAEVIGGVSRESISGRELDRATVRALWSRSALLSGRSGSQ